MKKTVYMIPHSHWDREWYLPFEQHRMRLVTLMDRILELMETKDYPAYHLDGQMIPLDDYLEIRPENRERVLRCIRSGKLEIGPWYVLQDEYLTSSEANVRNLMVGMEMAKEWGKPAPVGYMPDAFGNVGQMPQLFAQAGMKTAVFGRGITPVGRDGESDPAHHRPHYTDFLWESPDGTRIPAVIFPGWYNFGAEAPVDPEKAKAWWEDRMRKAENVSSGSTLLFMSGSDHQPVQQDLPEALETARKLFPDVDFVQATLEQYSDAVLAQPEGFRETVRGELEDQYGSGEWSLRNTASARWYLKQMNRDNEVLLEKQAEPLAVMAELTGHPQDKGLYRYAWKTLMQNHPHDSICGCSVDPVHAEMVTRFNKSIQTATCLRDEAGKTLAQQVGVSSEGGLHFIAVNTLGRTRSALTEAVLSVHRIPGVGDAREALKGETLPTYVLKNSAGEEVPCTVEDLGIFFGYDLPEDRFRQPWCERRIRVRFSAENVPAYGYETYTLTEGTPAALGAPLAEGLHMENDHVSVTVREDGTFDLTCKSTGRTYPAIGALEDVGDVGNEYIFVEAADGAVTTEGMPAEITLEENTGLRAVVKIDQTLELPVSAADSLREIQAAMTLPFDHCVIGRNEKTQPVTITKRLILERDAKGIRVEVSLNNTVKDHRLRLLVPTDFETDCHLADSVFDVVCRKDAPSQYWKNPNHCDRMHYLVAAQDGENGLLAANRGLYEYEILPPRKTAAITLLRCVGELGDWGDFPTEDSQCQGPFRTEVLLVPYAGSTQPDSGWQEAQNYQTGLLTYQTKGQGSLPARRSFQPWEGRGLIATAMKPVQKGSGAVLRLYNGTEEPSELVLTAMPGKTYYLSNILEEKLRPLTAEDGSIRIPMRGKEIVTVLFE